MDEVTLEKVKRTKELVTACEKALCQIDDYFEYAFESKRDQEFVHKILEQFTDKVEKIYEVKS